MGASLIQNDNYIRTVVDNLPSAIFVVDDEYKIVDLNPSATSLFKLKSDSELCRLCGDLLQCKNVIVDSRM